MSGPEGFHSRELSEHDEAGIIAAAVELGMTHSYEEALRVIHALTIRLAEKEETIAALKEALCATLGGAKPELRVVREDDGLEAWMRVTHDGR